MVPLRRHIRRHGEDDDHQWRREGLFKAAKYLDRDLQKVIDVPVIVQAFKRVGEIDRGLLSKLFSGDNIRVVINARSLPGYQADEWVYLYPTEGSQEVELRIDVGVLFEFDGGYDLRKTRSTVKVHRLGAIVLAALTSYPLDRGGHGIRRPGQAAADRFVRDMYGWSDRNAG